ncbi:MAG: UBP-type zinc finger domain-containing protein [Solirubrobacterales bacterium]
MQSGAPTIRLGRYSFRVPPESSRARNQSTHTSALIPREALAVRNSPNRHASGHARTSGHPLIRSLEPGEEWSWCFVDDVAC